MTVDPVTDVQQAARKVVAGFRPLRELPTTFARGRCDNLCCPGHLTENLLYLRRLHDPGETVPAKSLEKIVFGLAQTSLLNKNGSARQIIEKNHFFTFSGSEESITVPKVAAVRLPDSIYPILYTAWACPSPACVMW